MNERAFVDKDILREIESKKMKLDRMNRNPLSWLANHRILKNFIKKEAITHSFYIENPILSKTGNYDSHPTGRNKKKEIKTLQKIFNYGIKNFPKPLTEEFIQVLAAKIEPQANGNVIAGYRRGGSRIIDVEVGWLPPRREKIYDEFARYMFTLNYLLEQESTLGTVEAAAHAHLHLVRIHPFEDGNGRTARMLQNLILNNRGLPPPVIYEGERHDYYGHLNKAIRCWQERQNNSYEELPLATEEAAFYNYIAGKVSASLDRLITSIK